MKNDSYSEDIRDWAKGANEESEVEEDKDDELDDVQLSSEEDEG